MGGFGRLGVFQALSRVRDVQQARADKERKQRLEDLLFSQSQGDRTARLKSQSIEDALHQAQTGVANRTAALPAPPPPRDPVAVHAANRNYDVQHPVPVPGDKTLVQIQGPDGNPIWVPREQAIGKQARTTTRIESAMNTSAEARLKAAVSEMNNAHGGMADYEEKLRNKTANINGLEQFAGRVANSFTHDDPFSMTIQSTALATLNRTNPELARYIRRGLSFAEGESMISQRPSDFRTKMAAFLSTAATGASPEMIADIQSRRNSMLGPLNATVGGSKPVPAAVVPRKARHRNVSDAEFAAAWKAGKRTDAEIVAHAAAAGQP